MQAISVHIRAGIRRRCPCSAFRTSPLLYGAFSSSSTTTTTVDTTTTTTTFIGVRADEDTGSFKSIIEVDGAEVNGGTFSTAEEAARSYDMLVRIFEGDSAKTNFPTTLAAWDQDQSDQEHQPTSLFPLRPRYVKIAFIVYAHVHPGALIESQRVSGNRGERGCIGGGERQECAGDGYGGEI
jgi:hypothetical protein